MSKRKDDAQLGRVNLRVRPFDLGRGLARNLMTPRKDPEICSCADRMPPSYTSLTDPVGWRGGRRSSLTNGLLVVTLVFLSFFVTVPETASAEERERLVPDGASVSPDGMVFSGSASGSESVTSTANEPTEAGPCADPETNRQVCENHLGSDNQQKLISEVPVERGGTPDKKEDQVTTGGEGSGGSDPG